MFIILLILAFLLPVIGIFLKPKHIFSISTVSLLFLTIGYLLVELDFRNRVVSEQWGSIEDTSVMIFDAPFLLFIVIGLINAVYLGIQYFKSDDRTKFKLEL